MLPFEQGGLDSLCGLYSIVNAERVVNNTSNDDSLVLFNDIIAYLNKKRQLSGILVEGMYLKNVKIVLENVVGDRIPYQRLPFAGKPNPDLDVFWKEIQYFLEEKTHRAVILSLSGVHDHFTVIRSISDRQMQLFDSNAWYRINRTNVTTTNQTKHSRTVSCPNIFPGQELITKRREPSRSRLFVLTDHLKN
jgi:hypothetical protein